MMLQHLKTTGEGFYFSADHTLVKSEGLFNIVFYLWENYQVKTFYIDEVHKYKDWTVEIKNIYDSLPQVKVIFSGSSSLGLYKGILDLGRRANFYLIYPLNFSEFLEYHYGLQLPSFSLEQILKNHKGISFKYAPLLKDIYFKQFLKEGHYPFSKGISFEAFVQRLQVLLDKVVLEDLPAFLNFKLQSLDKLRKVFYFLSHIPPSELSFTSLSSKIGLDKNVIENALMLLDKIGLIKLVPKRGNVSDRIRKQYKILFGNPNLYFAYNLQPLEGVLRESFFVGMMRRIKNSEIFAATGGDFIVQI